MKSITFDGLPRLAYRTVVIDPPWPGGGAYSSRSQPASLTQARYETLPLRVIKSMPIPRLLHQDAQVFLWTTQRFLPAAIEMLADWGLHYCFTMVWKKNRGPKPRRYPWYNCEFVVVGRRGRVRLKEEREFAACFAAPHRGHSVKPHEFYATIRRVCFGPRCDLFARRKIPGFIGWGHEYPG